MAALDDIGKGAKPGMQESVLTAAVLVNCFWITRFRDERVTQGFPHTQTAAASTAAQGAK